MLHIFEANKETNEREWRTSLTGKHANWNSTCELTYSDPDVVTSRKDDTLRRWGGWSVFRRVRATELQRVLLRTIYDSNRRYSRRPAVNANMRYTWAQCGTAWQIQSKLYYAHSSFVTRCIVCRHLGPPSSPSCLLSSVHSLLFRNATLKADNPFPHRDSRHRTNKVLYKYYDRNWYNRDCT